MANVFRIKEILIQQASKVKTVDSSKCNEIVSETRPTRPPRPPKTASSKTVSSPSVTKIEQPTNGIASPERVEQVEQVPCTTPIDMKPVISRILIPNQDYGIIPGCGRKPSLLKSGAEKLLTYFGYRTTVTILNRSEDYAQHFVSYEVKVTAWDTQNQIAGEGVGAANSRERKFIKSDFYGVINNVLKIAKKRAIVDLALTVCNASAVFTQDIEDITSADPEEIKINRIG